jgi:aspartate/methionine/tyrosine aminotransferase
VTISRRARADLGPNELAKALARHRAARRSLLDLTPSNPTRAGLPYDGDAIRDAIAPPGALVHEPSPFGLEAARRAASSAFGERGVSVDPARIVLTASTSEAYAFLFKLLCDPGDAVLVPRPSYPLFEHLARYEGVRAIQYSLAYDGAWHVDLASVRKALSPGVRAVVLVSPNNPTGSFTKRDELEAIAALGLPIISDEVFAAYPLGPDDPRRARSALEASEALVFALDGLSKRAALPQLKLAWMAVGGPDALAAPALRHLELLADTFLSPAAPVQHALGRLLELGRTPRNAILERLRANRAVLDEATAGTAVTALPVEGGWYAVVRLPAVRSEERWALDLLEADGVLVQPGFFYDFEAEPFVVLSLLTEQADFEEGVRRLVRRVERA